MNVAPETAKYYGILALINVFGLPLDIAYLGFLNIAKEGNTQAIAQDKTTQIVAVANVAITAVGTIFGVVFNLVWQLVLWLQDIMNIDLTVTDMWGVLSLTARNFFEISSTRVSSQLFSSCQSTPCSPWLSPTLSISTMSISEDSY